MALGSIQDNTNNAFVESPTRTNKTAVEIVGSVTVSSDSSLYNFLSFYQETLAVVSGVTTTVLTHTFSATKISKIISISASGENVSIYELFVDSVLIEKKRTYFGSSLDLIFDFKDGYEVGFGSILELKVYHTRPTTAAFNATVKYLEAV